MSGRVINMVALVLSAGWLAGCGAPSPQAHPSCPAGGKPVEYPKGQQSCVQTPADIILTGDLPPSDPRVEARLRKAMTETGKPVAYTDGKTTRTLFPAR